VKDHGLLFSAFSNLSTSARLLLVGDGDPSYTEQLRRTARTLGIADRVIWWKRRSDLCAVYSAMNVLALPSVSEGCPNVVMEAMSCGTPCVLTPVGAASQLVGETGIVLADRQPQALAAALSKPLSGQGCRERMEAMFSLDRCADQTLDFLREAVLQRVAMA
jgi:glycosyltransferase involved in cell wall biosynthesis